MHQLNDSIFRSEQPSKKGFKELEKLGIQTILNLRNNKKDKTSKSSNLRLEHIEIKPTEVTYADVVSALKIIKTAPKPLLVHCYYGSDRTGVIVATYRMALCDWEREDAIDEFRKTEYGYHEKRLPQLLTFLQNLDIEKLNADLK